MPIILEDAGTAVARQAAAGPQYSPKDYNSVLTGNGVNQGLLRSTLLAGGSDVVSQNAVSILMADRYECENRAHHVHDDLRNYTTLWQDISLCSGYATAQNGVPAPLCAMTDHFATFERPSDGQVVTYRSRLFLNRIYVYKAATNYVLGYYTLIVAEEGMPTNSWIEKFDGLYVNGPRPKDPILDMYTNAFNKINAFMVKNGYSVKTDDSANLAAADNARSMYDLIMSELALIKTQGDLKKALQAASAAGYPVLAYANRILNLVNLPFALYQTDVIDVINARTRDEATQLKNANMSLSLADTLSNMQGAMTAQIPELVGKKYTTKAITLTTEQIAAIESPSRITIVAAGAGTGKSSCIMHRLAFMEENGCDMKQTFVLSFTKAAAGHIKKNFRDCKSSTIAEFTHSFVNVILDDGSGTRVDIVAHSDFVQKLKIRMDDLVNANILQTSTVKALQQFVNYCDNIDTCQPQLLNMLDTGLNPEAANLLSILKMLHCTSLELDPIVFHTQLSVLKPNIEHIVIDESQDSNRLEFLTMLKMAMLNDISIYCVGKA